MATKGYKIDFTNNTLVVNYKFHSASQEYGTPENKLVKKILKDFPSLSVVVKAGREVKTPSKNKRLTYANMEKHIMAYDNATELLEVFETVKALSQTVASPTSLFLTGSLSSSPATTRLPLSRTAN